MKKKILFLFIVIMIISCKISQAKYVIEKTLLIANINIDTIVPKIELINITSTEYKKNQNKMYKINIKIKVTENSIKENHFDKEKIKINIEGEEIRKELYQINKIQESENYIIYEIKIDEIMEEGEFKIIIPEGIIQDYANNKK